MPKIVNAWNEFDPLKRVIVGRADGCMIPPPELPMECKIPVDSDMRGSWGPRPQHTVDAGNAQLDGFARILEKRGIVVDRPTPIDFNQEIGTPDWKNGSMFGCMPPRDVILTVGNEMVEATMSYRCRWFEYLCTRPLLEEWYKLDPNMRWEAAPKPRLTDRSYKAGYLSRAMTIEARLKLTEAKDFVTTEEEPLFDAAELARCGKDIIVQHGFTANLAGIDWLRRHFADRGLRIHKMNFPGDPYPCHIDATLVPLRPGLVLNNPTRRLLPEHKVLFDKNDWEVVVAAQPMHKSPPPLCYSTVWVSMNVFMLDPKTVFCEASETNQHEQFDKLGLEVIPIPFRDVYPFGGGLHCATVDIYREGKCEDYFPVQVPGL